MTKNDSYNQIIERFDRMERFESVDDIPYIPIVSKEIFDSVIIPNLIRCGAIPKSKLMIGRTYIGSCRNAEKAVWTGSEFVYERHKFGTSYLDHIKHFQDDDGYDLFVPILEEKTIMVDVEVNHAEGYSETFSIHLPLENLGRLTDFLNKKGSKDNYKSYIDEHGNEYIYTIRT